MIAKILTELMNRLSVGTLLLPDHPQLDAPTEARNQNLHGEPHICALTSSPDYCVHSGGRELHLSQAGKSLRE